VGQKKAFPIPYSVAAPNIAHSTAPALAIQSKPHIVLENVLIAKPQPGQGQRISNLWRTVLLMPPATGGILVGDEVTITRREDAYF